jgi:hypothetical protein
MNPNQCHTTNNPPGVVEQEQSHCHDDTIDYSYHKLLLLSLCHQFDEKNTRFDTSTNGSYALIKSLFHCLCRFLVDCCSSVVSSVEIVLAVFP